MEHLKQGRFGRWRMSFFKRIVFFFRFQPIHTGKLTWKLICLIVFFYLLGIMFQVSCSFPEICSFLRVYRIPTSRIPRGLTTTSLPLPPPSARCLCSEKSLLSARGATHWDKNGCQKGPGRLYMCKRAHGICIDIFYLYHCIILMICLKQIWRSRLTIHNWGKHVYGSTFIQKKRLTENMEDGSCW